MSYSKSKSALPEKSHFILFEIGLIATLVVVLVAFNYKSPVNGERTLPEPRPYEIIEDISVITKQQKEDIKPPPVSPTEINIVEDIVEVEDILSFDVEDDLFTPAEDYIPEVPEETRVDEDEIYQNVEVEPAFPGGPGALQIWLSDHIEYPRSAVEANITGTVFLSFVVSKNGSVRDVTIMRGPDEWLNREALRVGRLMPDWKPGIIKGKPVNTRYVIPVKFMLQ